MRGLGMGYYHKTHNEWVEHHWNDSLPQNQTSPAFIYNQICAGADHGSFCEDAGKLMCEQGASNMREFPYDDRNCTSWPAESVYLHAISWRCDSSYWIDVGNDTGLARVKARLDSGYTSVLGIWVWENFDNIRNYNYTYCSSQRTPFNRGGHAVTFVGYDDSMVTADGKGAFRMVNSWNTYWGDSGYFWMSYQAVKDPLLSYRTAYYVTDKVGYAPTLLGRVQITHSFRDCVRIRLGVGTVDAPLWTKDFGDYTICHNGFPQPFPGNNIVFDMTEGAGYMADDSTHFAFVRCLDDSSDSRTGTIDDFSTQYVPWSVTSVSLDPPVPIPDFDSAVFAQVDVGLPGNVDMSATYPTQARHLVRRPNSEELHIVYQKSDEQNVDSVWYQKSTDGGSSWGPAEAVAAGANPCLALDYSGKPWISYNVQHEVHCAVRRSSTASPHWKDITVYGNENFAFGPASMVCSNIHDEVVPYPPDMGYLAFVIYSNSTTETLGHGSLMIAAFDTVHLNQGYHNWFCCELDQWNQADSLDSMPCIARTPGDLIHVVWQRGSPLPGGRELSEVCYRTTPHCLTPTYIRTSPYPFVDTTFSPTWVMTVAPQDSGSCPFIETWGDSVFAAYRYGGDHSGYYPGEIKKRARHIHHGYSQWSNPSPQSVADTYEFVETPVMSTRTAVVWRKSQYSGEKCVQDRFAGDQSPTLVYGTTTNVAYPHADVQLAPPPLPWATPGPDILRTLFTEQTGQNSYAVRVVQYVHSNANSATFYGVNVGDSTPSPFCIYRTGYTNYTGHKVDYANQTLRYGLADLNPAYHYALRLKFFRAGAGTTMQVKLADSTIANVNLPPGILESLWVDVPQHFFVSGNVELDITRTQGPAAVLAGLDVYQYEAFPQGGGGQQSGEINPLPIPKELVLEQSWPNPAARTLTIRYGIPRMTSVSLKVYDISGKVVRTLETNDKVKPGYYNIIWNCKDNRGRGIAGGVYFYRLVTRDNLQATGDCPTARVKTRKLVIAR